MIGTWLTIERRVNAEALVELELADLVQRVELPANERIVVRVNVRRNE